MAPPIAGPVASVRVQPERGGALLAAMLRPDHSRGRRYDPPEATDVAASAARAEARPRLARDFAGGTAGL